MKQLTVMRIQEPLLYRRLQEFKDRMCKGRPEFSEMDLDVLTTSISEMDYEQITHLLRMMHNAEVGYVNEKFEQYHRDEVYIKEVPQ